MNIPLLIKKNIRDADHIKKKNLCAIKNILNVNYEFICDIEYIYDSINEPYRSNIGTIIYEYYLGSLVKNIETLLTTDLEQKAFVDATSAKEILFKIDDLDYHIFSKCKILDKKLLIIVNKQHFPYNHQKTGSNIIEIL